MNRLRNFRGSRLTHRVSKAAAVASLIMGAMVGTSCLDLSTSPDEILFIAFERLPFPSVVVGDTLRDSTGVAASLTAQAVNARGDIVATAPLRFFAINDTAEIISVDSVTGIVVSEGDDTDTIRVIAALGRLQTPPLILQVAKQPDSLEVTAELDTVEYSFTDTTLNFSEALAVKVLHNDSTTFYSGVSGWLVRFSLENPDDTVSAALVDDVNRRLRGTTSGVMHVDTTDAQGAASRKLRIRPGPPLVTPLDSVAVIAESKYRGAHIAGSPARIWVFLRPRVAQQ